MKKCHNINHFGVGWTSPPFGQCPNLQFFLRAKLLLAQQSSKVVSSELNVSKEFSVSAVLKVEAFPELKIYLLFYPEF